MGLVGSISDIRGKGHRPAKVMASGVGDPPIPPLDFIWYGQSNALGHIATQGSPPPAAADTFVWDPGTSAWITPVGNGIREFLNAMTAATGLPCRAVYGGQSGVNISALQKGAGTGYYEDLMDRVEASGIDPQFICFHHGEGDANTASPVGATYQAAMDQIHGDIVADLGLTKPACPMIISSLATVTDSSFTQPDTSWQTIKDAQAGINAGYPNIHYSHSNMDATLSDGVHWNAASYGRSGKRYARTVQVLRGGVATLPKWFATAAERVSTTTTRITVVHAMGSDFTPASAITGFELTGNNGANWVSGTGEREDATHILVTHADLGTTERKIRYQHGKTPTVSAPVVDNSALSNLLNFTSADLVAPGSAALPSITYASSGAVSFSGNNQFRNGITVPGGSEPLLALIGHTMAGGSTGATYNGCNVTAQPSGAVIAATLVAKQDSVGSSTAPGAAIYQAELPSGTTSIDVMVLFGANSYATGRIHISTIPVANLSSTTKTGSGVQRTAATLSATTALATSKGGVIFCVGVDKSITAGNAGAFSGTETFANRNNAIANAGTHTVGDAQNISASASNSVTVTYDNSSDTTIITGSWR